MEDIVLQKGIKWNLISSLVLAVGSIIQVIFVTRTLSNIDMGIAILAESISGFGLRFIDLGISNAIVQKKEINNTELDSLFSLNILVGCFFSLLFFLSAPFIGDYYEEERITSAVKILSPMFIISSLGQQNRALLQRTLNFSLLAKFDMLAFLGSFFCTIIYIWFYNSYMGIVWGTLTRHFISALLLIAFSPFRKRKRTFSIKISKITYFIKFGTYQILSSFFEILIYQVDILLVGKLNGIAFAGMYGSIKQFLLRPAQLLNPVFTKVFFPAIAKVQDEKIMLKTFFLDALNLVVFFNSIIYVILFTVPTQILTLLSGGRWFGNEILFQLLCIYSFSISTGNPTGILLSAKGKTNIAFFWTAGVLLLTIIFIYFCSLFIGKNSTAVAILSLQLFLIYPNYKLLIYQFIDLSFKEYFISLYKALFYAVVSFILPFIIIHYYKVDSYIITLLLLCIGFTSYISLVYWKDKKTIVYIYNILSIKI